MRSHDVDVAASHFHTPSCSTGFFLFILVNLILFVRPAEIVPEWESAPIYEIVISLCLLASLPVVIAQLKVRSLVQNPTTVFVFAMLGAIFVSGICNGDRWHTRLVLLDYLKVIAYYLLLVGLVSTPSRFRVFALFLFIAVSIMALLVLMQNYGAIDVKVLHPMAEGMVTDDGVDLTTSRVVGLGIFSDPNDLALILIVAAVLGFHFIAESESWMVKAIWAAPVALVMWAFELTGSRGGLLAMGAAISTLLVLYLGWRRGLIVTAVIALVAIPFLGQRQTDLDIANSHDTAQGRMVLWRDSLVLLHTTPIVGVGPDRLVEHIGHVAHNSFVQSLAETGVIGGTIFVGIMYVPIWVPLRMRKRLALLPSDEFMRWNAVIIALAVGYAVGLFSLSRNYTVPTYIPPALATAWCSIVTEVNPNLACRFDRAMVRRVVIASVLCLATLEVCARFLIR